MNSSSSFLIETPRLLLREFKPFVNTTVFETYSDQQIMDFLGLTSIAELQLEQERYQLGFTMYGKSFNYFHLILKQSDTVIGWCGYHTLYTKHDRAELGYVLNHDTYKGCGYMKEALPFVIQYGFEILKLHRIEAFISDANIPSLRLLLGNNFIKEGILREHYLVNGKHEDSTLYSLLKSDFTI